MTISVAVMAVRQRAHFVEQLLDRLGVGEDRVVWDQKQDRCDTGLRAMQAYDPDASHHLVIQDDALVCNDLLPGLERLVEHTGDYPVSLYVGRVRPHPQQVQEHFDAARRAGRPLLRMHGPLWGVGIVYPTADLDELCAWFPRQTHKNYDMRVSRWYMHERNRDCLYTIPSLADHRPVAENPSTIKGRTGNRRAHWFIGEDASALTVDWQSRPVHEHSGGPPAATHSQRLTFRHSRLRALKTVDPKSAECRRLRRNRLWEEVADESAPAS